MPLALAGTLALVFMRFCDWLERKGMPRLLTAVLSGLIFTGMVAGMVLLVNWYIHRFTADLPQLQLRVRDCIESAKQFLKDEWGIRVPHGSGSLALLSSVDAGKMTTSVLGSVSVVVVHLILIVVYMVMLLTTRAHIKSFFLKLVRAENEDRIKLVLYNSVKVVQEYLYGMMIIIAFLWVMYGIGFSVIGVRYALFFAVLCGLLEIIPFVGNITGSTLTCVMALSQGGGIQMVLGILGTYAIIQFIQFYIISPLVMRAQVNISPLFTIVSLIAGELLWGIPGMILAIPCLGILKVVCDEVEFLRPMGFLLGRSAQRKNRPGKKYTWRKWFHRHA